MPRTSRTAFTVEGIYLGRSVSLTWDRGSLTGDEGAVEEFQSEAERRERLGVRFFPEGEWSKPRILSDKYQSYLLLHAVIEVVRVTGNPPREPERLGV